MYSDQFGFRDEMVWREHFNEIQREVEQQRLVHLALAGREKRLPVYSRILAGLGQSLVTWGLRLQELNRKLSAKTIQWNPCSPEQEKGQFDGSGSCFTPGGARL